MRALLLTSYYLVFRSLLMYTGIAVVIAALMLTFGDESMYAFVVILTLIFVAIPSLEILKHEGKSGYDKYVLTLPVSRKQVVMSQYLFYLVVVTLGAVLSILILNVYTSIVSESIHTSFFFSIVGPGIGLILILGATIFPLLYYFGFEKSDGILVAAAVFSLFASIGLEKSLNYSFNNVEVVSKTFQLETYLPIAIVSICIVFLLLSCLMTVVIYNKKEF